MPGVLNSADADQSNFEHRARELYENNVGNWGVVKIEDTPFKS